MVQVFLTGATGYIGGSILARFTDQWPSFNYRALTRSTDKASKLNQFKNIEAVVGDNNSFDLIEDEAKKADVVIHTANSADDMPSTKAIVSGIEKGKGKSAIYIHVSGTGALVDDARGLHDQHTTYDDSDSQHINTLPTSQVHRDVDEFLLEHSDKMQLHIVYPSTVWGQAVDHALYKAGISNCFSVQMPSLAAIFVELKQAKVVGDGKNIWPNVHIYERLVVDLFQLILRNAIEGKISSDKSGSYFFGVTDHYYYSEAVGVMANALSKHGRISSANVESFSSADFDRFDALWYFGSNCRGRATRARSLGWKPQRGTKDFYADLPKLVQDLIQSGKV
ncbi:hypothetical protein E3P88_00699 [Wallemia ichthyophaga]|nr:hypothetical protein E3P88_00699 [Wallemia ichthyophaga]